MNRNTEIIVGIGGVGKTAELIKRSAESGIYILVANRKRAEILVKQAEDMKLYIPFPVTLQEWLRSDNRFHGSSIRRDGLLIDDVDDVIKELFLPIEIKAVTLRTPHLITNLDNPAADVTPKSEVAREIFKEIERLIELYAVNTPLHIPFNYIDIQFMYWVDELKKKYTEGEK